MSKIVINVKPAGPKVTRCVKCGDPVNPSFSHTGKVLACFSWITRESLKTNPVTHAVDLEKHVVRVSQYDKGYLCDTCCADYSWATDERTGKSVQVVITDPRVTKPADERIGFKSNKRLNTRYTR